MKKALFGAAALALVAGTASAQSYRGWTMSPAADSVTDLQGNNVRLDGQRSPASSEIYSVFSGLATSTGGLVLVESGTSPVPFDDLVNYDGASESINPYLNIAGSGAVGQSRTVVESKVVGGNSTTLTITITSPGDLWPSGLAAGGGPLTRGGVGVGLNLGTVLGNNPLLWSTPTVPVTAGTLEIIDSGGSSGPISLPLATFFGNGNWNGILGVVFNDTTSPTGVTGFNVTTLRFTITTSKIPAPGAVAVFGLAGAVAARRRRA